MNITLSDWLESLQPAAIQILLMLANTVRVNCYGPTQTMGPTESNTSIDIAMNLLRLILKFADFEQIR